MGDITIKKVNLYGKDTDPKTAVANEYPTSHFAIRQPCLVYCSSVRNSGKSFLISKLVRQAQKEKTFNQVYIITPTFESNRAYFGDMIDDENVFQPTKTSIQEVIDKVEEDKEEWEKYLVEKREYDFFMRLLKNGKDLTDEQLLKYMDMGFLEDDKIIPPKWKYGKPEPPKSLLILDDVLSSPALLQSSGLTKVATLNRHICPLTEEFVYPDGMRRSACGLAVIIISQTYSMSQGVSRALRENLTHLILFENKQEKMFNKIREELGGAVDEEKFLKAYHLATKAKYGNLLVDFNPKCPTQRFRKNLNELLIFPDDLAQCNCPE
tara:strand:- start:790 stop:1758 length:969 start_codon:yes stop_codon:yes gene_type:complete